MEMSASMGRNREFQSGGKELGTDGGVAQGHKRKSMTLITETPARHTKNIFDSDVFMSVGLENRKYMLSQFGAAK